MDVVVVFLCIYMCIHIDLSMEGRLNTYMRCPVQACISLGLTYSQISLRCYLGAEFELCSIVMRLLFIDSLPLLQLPLSVIFI